MAKITKEEAVQKLSDEIAAFSWDDVIETHNELFPFEPLSVDADPKGVERVRKKVMDRITGGIEAEEIIDLWNVVFPSDRNVWYDDEGDCVRYNEEPQRVESSD